MINKTPEENAGKTQTISVVSAGLKSLHAVLFPCEEKRKIPNNRIQIA